MEKFGLPMYRPALLTLVNELKSSIDVPFTVGGWQCLVGEPLAVPQHIERMAAELGSEPVYAGVPWVMPKARIAIFTTKEGFVCIGSAPHLSVGEFEDSVFLISAGTQCDGLLLALARHFDSRFELPKKVSLVKGSVVIGTHGKTHYHVVVMDEPFELKRS